MIIHLKAVRQWTFLKSFQHRNSAFVPLSTAAELVSEAAVDAEQCSESGDSAGVAMQAPLSDIWPRS